LFRDNEKERRLVFELQISFFAVSESMSRRYANRFVVLSSDSVEEPDDETSGLPPSDPPEPFSGSEDEAGAQTPIRPMKSLLASTIATESSPLAAREPRRIQRHQRSSSAPPAVFPSGFSGDEDEQPHVSSEDVLYTPRTEWQHLNARRQLKRRETLVAKVCRKSCVLFLL
jgi:hypothetical protein